MYFTCDLCLKLLFISLGVGFGRKLYLCVCVWGGASNRHFACGCKRNYSRVERQHLHIKHFETVNFIFRCFFVTQKTKQEKVFLSRERKQRKCYHLKQIVCRFVNFASLSFFFFSFHLIRCRSRKSRFNSIGGWKKVVQHTFPSGRSFVHSFSALFFSLGARSLLFRVIEVYSLGVQLDHCSHGNDEDKTNLSVYVRLHKIKMN